MIALLSFALNLVASFFKSRSQLEAEKAALRQQLIVLQRKVRGRVEFTNSDRRFLIQLYRWFPSILKAETIIRPETLVRWHPADLRQYWRWKSRNLGGRGGNRVAPWEPIVPLMRPTGGTAARRPRLVRLDPLRPAARGRGARGNPIQQRDHVLDLGAIEPLRDEYDLAAAVMVRPAVEP